MHRLYANTLTSLYLVHGDRLRRPFCDSVFPAISINFTPAVSVPHRDHANLADGLCWVLAGGSFDPKRGGHMVLHELKLLIEFPPGSSILFPSAILTHSNTAIQEGEERWSVTQFAAGGLFRWVEYGYHTIRNLGIYHRSIEEKIMADRPQLWRKRLALLSSPASLHADRDEIRTVTAPFKKLLKLATSAMRARDRHD